MPPISATDYRSSTYSFVQNNNMLRFSMPASPVAYLDEYYMLNRKEKNILVFKSQPFWERTLPCGYANTNGINFECKKKRKINKQ